MPHTTSSSTNDVLQQRLSVLSAGPQRDALTRGLRGIEKESLRVTRDGRLATTSHPVALGSALTHPSLTTDYSEALLEIITSAEPDASITLDRLDELHRYVYAVLDRQNEFLWNQSMPGLLPDTDEGIPIAHYGTSNIGRLKYVYRVGLALRYGRTMQCIAGIHYNYSLDDEVWRVLHADQQSTATQTDYRSERYLALIRNFRRTNWLLMYLFGASPALDARFLRGRPNTLDTFDADTLYLPYATSLRMSDLGYSNTTGQSALHADYDTLPGYLDALAQAVSQPYPPYEAIGTHRDGEWVQINTNVLQIENEFYSTIRPKRVTYPGERPLHALGARGVQYVEVRCMDIDPFEPIGLSLETARFLDAYLLACALDDSPSLPAPAYAEANENFSVVTKEGRRPGLELKRDGRSVPMHEWADELFGKIDRTAAALDTLRGDDVHTRAVAAQRAKLADASLTPSARVLQTMRDNGQSFLQFGLAQSERHAADFLSRPLDAETTQHFEALARQSLDEQAKLERDEVGSFDAFVAAYRAYTLNRFSV
ncbi:glutamate--cysteine ligase [Paraburkholderia caballeronis]|uniref:Glutamate--cysteine ligase n=1 Tax=Paraburkholderia caballeronis TaxID=416943 RepID=A0A1H7H3H7_9BURK|nr:glutamate--cysteine ligase [Paraburkholderia caballeronis]PXW29662.1 glutamate-cysteine ligase [Paraburkholderia caballeronis]PXX04921.1 glutamate-cysteine ligase [Paraburkholderia caballeronis]RAK05982.1 glutamate-cysteine ligase [Paraburkholderia caballeronis]SEB45525.1 glutamate-cysteine ligase [Paraburkholderia caballeronis]SEK44824.1 glutamate-cysteine ligase [Paraburkholderia caballeronis]